jgi:hypothetical protein
MFYRRIVDGAVTRKYKLAIYVAMFFVVACAITFTLILIFTCKPVNYYWLQFDLTPHSGTCISPKSQATAATLAGVTSVISDLYCILFPASLLTRLRISKRQTLGLLFIFSLGFM